MLPQNLVYLAALLILIGDIGYLIDTVKAKIKPNRVSWFIWFLAPLIAYIAQFQQQVGTQAIMTLAITLVPLFIFLATFLHKVSEWKLTKIDFICGALSLAGVFLWWITQVGNVAILFSIAADLLAGIPTVIKSYTDPDSESYFAFFMNSVAALLTLLTITTWNFQTYGFPLYIFLLCLLLTLLIKFRLGKKISKIISRKN